MTNREIMQQALDALKLVYEQADFSNGVTDPPGTIDEGRVVIGGIVSESIQTLEAALAQPEQKLIGWKDGEPQYIEQPEQEQDPEIVRRVRRYAGKRRESVGSPHINAKECIALANWIDSVLAQPEQEPVAWVESLEKPQPRCVTNLNYRSVAEAKSGVQFIPLYTSPQKREWQELTDEDWHNLPTSNKQGCERDAEIFNWIEDKLKEKNT